MLRILDGWAAGGQTDGWTDGRTDGWIDGRTDRWTGGGSPLELL